MTYMYVHISQRSLNYAGLKQTTQCTCVHRLSFDMFQDLKSLQANSHTGFSPYLFNDVFFVAVLYG
jgi:hypothetical protein